MVSSSPDRLLNLAEYAKASTREYTSEKTSKLKFLTDSHHNENIFFLPFPFSAAYTLQNIFARHGFESEKLFALPKASMGGRYKDRRLRTTRFNDQRPFSVVEVYPIRPDDEFDDERQRFELLMHHMTLDMPNVRRAMPSDIPWFALTMIRDPVEFFVKTFVGGNGTDTLEYLALAKNIDISKKINEKQWKILIDEFFLNPRLALGGAIYSEYSKTKLGGDEEMLANGITRVFGLPLPHTNSGTSMGLVERFWDDLDGFFNLVMFQDRFEESMILMSDMMDWPLNIGFDSCFYKVIKTGENYMIHGIVNLCLACLFVRNGRITYI